MSIAQQAAIINFEDKLLACKKVPGHSDWLILVTKQEVALVELGQPHGMTQKASIRQEEIETEVHQVAVSKIHAKQLGAAYLDVLILHDEFMLLKLVLNLATMKFH